MNEPANPDCAAILASISAFLDGELGAIECADIERHCARCPNCGTLVEGLRHTIGLCREIGTGPLPEAVRERARESAQRLLDADARAHSE